MILTTSLQLCKKNGACEYYFNRALALAKEQGIAKATPVPIIDLVGVLPIEAVVWTLQATPKKQREVAIKTALLFACDCAEHVLPILEEEFPTDNRPRKAIETARLFLKGKVTLQEFKAALYGAALPAATYAAAHASAAAAYAAHAVADAACADVTDATFAAALAAVIAYSDYKGEWQENKLKEYLGGKTE